MKEVNVDDLWLEDKLLKLSENKYLSPQQRKDECLLMAQTIGELNAAIKAGANVNSIGRVALFDKNAYLFKTFGSKGIKFLLEKRDIHTFDNASLIEKTLKKSIFTDLGFAINSGNFNLVKQMLSSKIPDNCVSVKKENGTLMSPFSFAICKKQFTTAYILLENNPNLYWHNDEQAIECAGFFLENLSSLNQNKIIYKIWDGLISSNDALKNEALSVMEKVLSNKDKNINISSFIKNNLIEIARRGANNLNNDLFIDKICKEEKQANQKNVDTSNKNIGSIKKEKQKKARLDILKDMNDGQKILFCIKQGWKDELYHLVKEEGLDINSPINKTPVPNFKHVVLNYNNHNMIKAYINLGGNLISYDQNQNILTTAAHQFIKNAHNFGVTKKNGKGKNKTIEMLDILIKKIGDINIVDNKGNSILHTVCESGLFDKYQIIEYLLENKIDVKIKNENGLKAIQVLRDCDNLEKNILDVYEKNLDKVDLLNQIDNSDVVRRKIKKM